MSVLVLERNAVFDFVEGHPNKTIYGPNGTFFIPQGEGLWRKVEGTDEDIDLIFAHELLSGISRFLSADEMSHLFPGDDQTVSLSEMADELTALHVMTEHCWEARDFLREDRVEIIDDLGTLERLLPENEMEAAIEKAFRNCGVEVETGRLPMDYYSYDDLTSIFTYSDIQEWLESKPLDDFIQSENVTHDRDGFVTYMAEKVCLSSWWTDASHDKEDEVVDALVAAIEGAVHGGQLLPSYLEVDVESMRTQLLESVVWDRVAVDPDIERAMSSWGDVCVDLFLTDGEEWNSDFSNIGLLYEAQQGQDVYQEAVVDALANNGMSWFATQLGLRRDVMLTASEEGVPGHEFYEELMNVASSTAVMAIFCRLSLEDWITCIEAKEKGDSVVLSGNTFLAGLVDPWGGGGSILEMSLDSELVVPNDNVLDAAIDPSGHNVPRGPFGDVGLVSNKVFGISVKSIYGTDESLYKPGFINAPVALEKVGIQAKGGINR